MRNQAARTNKKQLTLFSGGEAVEDLLYEFLKNRSPLTERAYRHDLRAFFEFTAAQFGLPRSMRNKLLFGEIRRVHVVKYKKYLDEHVSRRKAVPSTLSHHAPNEYEVHRDVGGQRQEQK